jgi:alanine-synthesizing transaminase
MTGFWAGEDLTPNGIERRRRHAAQQPGYIDLASSNPTHQSLLFPPDVLSAAAETYWTTRRYEPDPHGALAAREAIAGYYQRRVPSYAIEPEHIFVTASTSEAYSLLFALLTEPGDNLLSPEVTYPLFEFLAAIHHVELRTYRMREEPHWHIDQESLLYAADDRTRGVLVVSPHNPTGMVVAQPIKAIAALELPVIADEVFAPWAISVPHVPPFGTLHPGLPVFHLNGISKMFGLPDLKLGWIALDGAAYARWGDRLELLNDTFLGANSLTQHMLPTLFAEGEPFVTHMVERVRANIDLALGRFASSELIHAQRPDGGYYLFPRIDTALDEESLVLHLLGHGLNVHPGYFYGYERGVHLMLSGLTEPATFAEGIERLTRVIEA